ncbi:CarD family transcriptional regulator [Romboutsia sp. 1001713B170207_170306_H8]|uniref:CarD family transcriptional regulator n=1 Tax=Romboutsia sp. 1001713B170207_170306_H8 TaxID=2787112 RepID=UPI000823500D|nr:CarD family transcriptional regulator [Romboutsia sp. 1001713B170207_170306_H8]SCH32736.1 CarD-like/TRCF domain [uncultured Clostridium sp.]
MYKVGDLIIYGSSGVCKVEDIGVPNITGINNNKDYYTLKPVYQDGKIFTPVDTNIFMRPIMSYKEVQELIDIIPTMQKDLIYDKNARVVEDYYKEFLETHDCSELLTLIKMLYEKKADTINNKKKPSQIDEKFMSIAENLINEEFSVVLGIEKDEVPNYIGSKLDNTQVNNE